MRENNKLTSLLKYICITTSVSCAFVTTASVADGTFDPDTFINGILNYTGTDWYDEYWQPWGDALSAWAPAGYAGNTEDGQIVAMLDGEPFLWTTGKTGGMPKLISQQEWILKNGDAAGPKGFLYGEGVCSNSAGDMLEEDSPAWVETGVFTKSNDITNDGGNNCWCKITGVSGPDGLKQEVKNSSYVFFVPYGEDCSNSCAFYCPNVALTSSGFRSALLSGTPKITVASTAYVTNKFTPISTELNTTIGTIETVVENTIIQADRISALHTGKQNRPDDYNDNEKCPDGYNCLLISDANGVPHWWPIVTGDTSSGGDNTGGGTSSTFDASAFIAGISTTEDCGDERYYRYDREEGDATKYDIPNDEETETTIQLSAGEWRVKKNDYGTIYGTSMCSVTNDGKIFSQVGNPGSTDGGKYCWCKMTGLAGTDGTKHDVSVGSWVFNYGSADAFSCEYDCVSNCTARVRDDYDFRSAVLGGGD